MYHGARHEEELRLLQEEKRSVEEEGKSIQAEYHAMNQEVKQLVKQRESLKLERSDLQREYTLQVMKTLEPELNYNARGLFGKPHINLGPDNLRAGDVLNT